MKHHTYIVVAKNGDGVYVPATHRRFTTHRDAELFLRNLSVTRDPIIVMLD